LVHPREFWRVVQLPGTYNNIDYEKQVISVTLLGFNYISGSHFKWPNLNLITLTLNQGLSEEVTREVGG